MNDINWGIVYESSWWGSVNEANGWGSVYPFDADGSRLSVDTTIVLSDTTQYKASQTQY